MDPIALFFAELPVSATLRERLYSPEALPRQRFYLELLTTLAPAFPGIDPEDLANLRLGAYLYFRHVLYLGDVLNGAARLHNELSSEALLAHMEIYERATRVLATLFPGEHPFWFHLDECKQALNQAIQAEARATFADWTRERFEQLAVGKSAISDALVYALWGLSRPLAAFGGSNLMPILAALREYHLAAQYEEDVRDFRRNCAAGRITYAHAELRAWAAEHQLVMEDANQTAAYLHISGIAERHYQLALHHYAQSAASLRQLGLPVPASRIELQAGQVEEARARRQVDLASLHPVIAQAA